MAGGGQNVVEITVTSADESAAGFDEAKAQADETAASFDAYSAAIDRVAEAQARYSAAADEQNAAMERLDELQTSGSASADELAAAQDKLTTATLASLDAQTKLLAATEDLTAKEQLATTATEEQGAKTEESGGLMAAAGDKMKMALLGVAVGAGVAVHAAGNFQQTTDRLVTSAGESAKNLGMVQQGILQLSSATNTSTSQLAAGMYTVESAGYHGAQGLTVLKAAAQGAQAEGAQLSTVANAVTSGLNAYGLSASHATSFTNQMLVAVGQGKMTMEALAGSLAAVLPVAAAAHLSFAQVGGAIATMTAQGTSADEAAQLLRHTITSLQGPNQVQIAEMQQLGVNSNNLAKNIGTTGLTGTIQQLEEAILQHMGPAGMVLLNAFNQSKLAAQSAQEEIAAMPPALQKLAQAYSDGKISVQEWQQELFKGNFSANQKMLLEQFATTEKAAHGFNSQLAAGGGDAQTFTAALSKVMGGAEGLQVALQVGGAHAATFQRNVNAVAAAANHGGQNIQNWGMIQKQFNFQLGDAEKAIEAAGISLGSALLPAVTAIIHPLADLLQLIAGNKAASIALAVVVGGVLAGALGSKLAGAFSDVKGMITSTGEGLAWLAAKLGITTAATEAQTVATEEGTVAQEAADVAMDANPIGAIIMAITALIAIIVLLATHWRDVEQWAKDAWHGIQDATVTAWHAIDSGAIQPLQHAISDVIGFFDQLLHDGESNFDALRSVIETAVNDVLGFFANLWHQGLNNFDMLRNGIVTVVGDVISWFEQLPGKILSALSALGSMLYNAGRNAIQYLINGIESMAGSVGSVVSGIASKVAGFFGLSPAKEGPLSGPGAPFIRGQHFAMDLAAGMNSVRGQLGAAAAGLAGGMAVGGGGYGAGGGTGGGRFVFEFTTGGGSAFDQFMTTWIREHVRILGGGDVQLAFGRP